MANVVYPNKVISAKVKDLLTTMVNARSLMTIDTALSNKDGMIRTINTYTYTGAVERLEEGKGNTTRGAVSYVSKDYPVSVAQQAFDYVDEDAMKDSNCVDAGLKGATQLMANDMTKGFYDALATTDGADSNPKELVQSVNFAKGKAISYDVIVDAISALNLEDETKVFVVIPNTWKSALRKDPDYKSARMGEVIYRGQVATICGIPVICTKALTDKAYVMTNEAVTLFMKKDVEVEQERNADKRLNSVYLRDYYICALTDATKACCIKEAQA